MSELNIAFVTIGGLVLGLGLLSGFLKRTFLSLPLLALGAGVLLGPAALGLLDPARWGRQEVILEQASRLTLAIGLMGVALRLPPSYLRQHWRSVAVLLGFGMALMCLSTGLLAHWLLGVPLGVAMLLGAVVTPTDPVVATSIVTGSVAEDNLPERVRHMLSAESGANDGLAYPIVLLVVLLLEGPGGEAWTHWLLRVMLWEVGGAVLGGAALGLGAARLLRWAEARKTIERHSFLAFTIALSLLALGAAKLLGCNGVLAVFVAGVVLGSAEGSSDRVEEENVQEAVNQFFTLPIFVLFGLMLPWTKWQALGWRGLALAAAVLLLRRLPFVLALRPVVPLMKNRADALFAGWFGPIGVAALFYAMLALRHTGHEIVWSAGSLLVCASLVAHGTTAAAFARLYGRRRRGEASSAPALGEGGHP